MELIFIRHGQGEHTLNIPQSLHIDDPPLTSSGITQAKGLAEEFPLTEDDILIVSPLRRTLQTAELWSKGVECKKVATPLVSPRLFPQISKAKTLPCDQLLEKRKIQREFPNFYFDEGEPNNKLWANGINVLPEKEFREIAKNFINWCRQQDKERIFVVSHDGTITSYREFITGRKLSRADFPNETGWFSIEI